MGSSIIEVGIGLILVYAILSLLVSQINNIIKNLLNVRGSLFQQEIARLLHDPKLKEAILNYPAIKRLIQASDGSTVRDISAEDLAEVFIDVLAGNGETLEMLEGLTNSPLVDQIVNSVEDEALKQKLWGVLRTARSLANVKEKLAQWFDTALSTAHDVYQRRMQLFSFACGAALALILNVDTIYVARALWNDPVLRQATVDAANAAAQTDLQTQTGTEDLQQSVEVAQATVNQFLELRLPIGWYNRTLDPATEGVTALQDTRNLWNILPGGNEGWPGLLIEKIAGLLLTTIAVMQGAPFWFDLLRRASGRG
jgi:hypothetical protein